MFGATDTDLAVPSELLADRTIRLFTLHKCVQVKQHANLLSLLTFLIITVCFTTFNVMMFKL